MLEVDLADDAGASFDQTKAEVIAALRKEKKGFFVILYETDKFAWHTMTDLDGCESFLRAVIGSARAELAELAKLAGVQD